ncbi:septum formation initiator family protein [Umezawaea beigongshangensis]|uniref:septum formation initiator family protein n=1 Tax=Umezawaea beigongshangensis TaxID=2780383 RepID=UPI0018F1D8BB|nr:septum formation initiator family protein [Umezawaea beigongshangensis]
MTAPARVGDPSSTPARRSSSRERSLKAVPEGTSRATGAPRTRSAAAERAHARRAQRAQDLRGNRAPARQPSTASRAPFVVMVMAVLGVGLASIMWLSTSAATDSYELEKARAQATELARRVEQLKQDVAYMESPTMLGEQAERLGMVQPDDPARLKQNPDGSVEEFGTPAPAAPPPPSASPAQRDQDQQDAQRQAGGSADQQQSVPGER